MRRLSVEVVNPKPKPETAKITETPTSSRTDPLTAAIQAIGFALSARALLLLALIGAFVLAVMAMLAQSLPSLEVLIAYAIFTVIPVSYLEVRRRQG